ncbi:MAG: hypothetical protein C0606_06545 [Hyphomicrobiales bacterium]|nr:MAG: hypothetical protein C0606_06545 [Hyphomicrobiales bacterium]
MPRLFARPVWPALVLSLVLAACGQEPPKEWMTDTRVPFVDYGLVWMDNDRLMFQRMEYDAKKAEKDNPWAAFTFPLSVWSDEGGLETLSRADITNPCYAPATDTLSYQAGHDGSGATFVAGRPGAMTKTPLNTNEDSRLFNRFICAYQDRPANLEGRILVPLKPGDGVVDLGRQRSADAGRLIKADVAAIPLPFSQNEVSPEGISADGDGYLVHARTKRGADCRPIWRLVPGTGATEEACLPEMKSSRVVRTALGWALDKREYDRDGDIGDSGIFLARPDGETIKLASGFTENLAASPDGCRLAFGQARDLNTSCTDGTYKQKTVKIIDLCRLKGEILGEQ